MAGEAGSGSASWWSRSVQPARPSGNAMIAVLPVENVSASGFNGRISARPARSGVGEQIWAIITLLVQQFRMRATLGREISQPPFAGGLHGFHLMRRDYVS